MSLRRRLVLGTLLLLVVGLVTIEVVSFSSLRSFLIGRLDEQIEATQSQVYRYVVGIYDRDLQAGDRTPASDPTAWLGELATTPPAPGSSAPATPRPPRLSNAALSDRLSSDAYVLVLSPSGSVLFRDPSGTVENPDPAPVLPADLDVQHLPPASVFGRLHGPYVPQSPSFDLSARGSGVTYRAQAVAVPGGVVVTAFSLSSTNETLASLVHVELLVSIAVIVALLLLALWIVRVGMRPLDHMTETATAIGEGDLTRRVASIGDRSEVGRLGVALNAMLSQIEAAFGERTASESRLRRFVADASHELRTPLTSIRGYAELLRKGAFASEDARHQAAERIESEAARMSLLVDDLLLLARLDQGRPLELAPVDLRRVVVESVEAWKVHDGRHPLTTALDQSVTVIGDAPRLRQIADNLLRNAGLHTPDGTPVRVTVERRGPWAVLEVADEGPGLDVEQAARVFDRFYRGSQARTGEGTGLGLSIVAALAAAHGGSARVDTTPGRGAVFTVELPLGPVPVPEAPAPMARTRAPSPAPDSATSHSATSHSASDAHEAQAPAEGARQEHLARPVRR